MSEILLEKSKEMSKERWGKKTKKRREKHLGFFLQAHFEGKPWTLKDLSEEQLATFIVLMERCNQNQSCCEKHNKKKV